MCCVCVRSRIGGVIFTHFSHADYQLLTFSHFIQEALACVKLDVVTRQLAFSLRELFRGLSSLIRLCPLHSRQSSSPVALCVHYQSYKGSCTKRPPFFDRSNGN